MMISRGILGGEPAQPPMAEPDKYTPEVPETKSTNQDNLLTSLLRLRQAQDSLDTLFVYKLKDGKKQEIKATGGGHYDIKSRPDSHFVFTVNKDQITQAITSDITREGKLALTDKRKKIIKDKVSQTIHDILEISTALKKANQTIFTCQELQDKWQAVFGDSVHIDSWETVDKLVKSELDPFFSLWKTQQAKLQKQYENQQTKLKGSILVDELIEESQIDQISAWQITGMDNFIDELSQDKQTDFKDMLVKIFSLPGEHQCLKDKFFINNQITCGDSQAVLDLLSYYHQEKVKARNIEMDINGIHLEYIITQARQALDSIPEVIPREENTISLETAQDILGTEKVFGPEAVEKVWGVKITEVPPIPYTKEDLEKAKQYGMYLILRIDKDQDGRALSSKRMEEVLQPRFDAQNAGKIFYNKAWYQNETFFTTETPQPGWSLTSGEILTGSNDKNYVSQTRLLRDKLKELGWLSKEEERECSDERLEEIERLIAQDWKEASRQLAELKITQNHRSSFSDINYDRLLIFASLGKRILKNEYNWSKTLSAAGRLVNVGGCGSQGAGVGRWGPGNVLGNLGMSFSR